MTNNKNLGNYEPPQSLEAEKAVLGAVLRTSDNLNLIAEVTRPEHFFLDTHREIYTAMLDLYKSNESADILTVADKLKSMMRKGDGFGPAYLVELMENCPVTQNVEHYAAIVRQKYYLRKIVYKCQDTIHHALQSEGSVASFVEGIEREFLEITNEYDRKGIVPAGKVLESTIDEIQRRLESAGAITGIHSGFTDLDAVSAGWQKSDLVLLAARPAMGKTALALNFAINAVKTGSSVVIFTLEMSKEQLMSRLFSAEARVDSSRLRRGDLTDDEQDRLMEGARRIYKLSARFGIDETPGISLLELRSRCRRFQKEHGLDLVVIDYLQLMTSYERRTDTREREISEISRGLKALAKELDIAVVALAQLNRGPDARPDKRPKLSDLRESGSMEQDADLILFVYRDEYYNPNSEHAGKAELIVGKNRHGPTKTVELAFQPNFVSFHNLLQE